MANASILGIVVGKLCYRKKPCPIILLEVDKDLKIDFYFAILPFGLTVRLLIKSNKESPLDTKEIT